MLREINIRKRGVNAQLLYLTKFTTKTNNIQSA